jgi:cytochrome c oxidase cbb3-type subunit 2
MAKTELHFDDAAEHMKTLRIVGVPYTDEQIAEAANDLAAQANGDEGDTEALLQRYPKAVVGDFDGDPSRTTELDAVIAYLQMLGTLVNFSDYDPDLDYR